MFVEPPVEAGQPFPVGQRHGLVAQARQARPHFGGEFPAHGQIVAPGALHPHFLVGPAAILHLAGGAFAVLELSPPLLGFAPAGQGVTELAAIFHEQVHALAARGPEQVQVGGEMDVGLQHAGVHLHRKRRAGRAAFFLRTPGVRQRRCAR